MTRDTDFNSAREAALAFFNEHRQKAKCLCGDSRGYHVAKYGREGLRLDIQVCRTCGHTYQSWQLAEAHQAAFYSLHYRRLYGGRSPNFKSQEVADRKGESARRWIYEPLSDMINPGGGTIVEWGCGAGWNLVPFASEGFKCVGYDPDLEHVAWGAQRFGLVLRSLNEESVAGCSIPNDTQLIILNHVLEHVVDPVSMLHSLAAQLRRERGLIFIGLPVIENIPLWGWRNFWHVAHIHYFSTAWVNELFDEMGLTTLSQNPERGEWVLRVDRKVSLPKRWPSHTASSSRTLLGQYIADRIVRPIGRRISTLYRS